MSEKLSLLEVCARARKARLRATSERSVRDAVKAGELPRNDDGTFDSTAVGEWIERKVSQVSPREEREGEMAEIVKDALFEMREVAKVATKHVEEIFRLFKETAGASLNAVVNTNTSLTNQLKESQDNLIEMQTALGDLNLRRAEIKAQEDLSKAKVDKLSGAFMVFANMLPKLMEQASGQRDLKEMFQKMTPEEKELFLALGQELPTDEKRVAFRRALDKMGVKPITPVSGGVTQ